MRICTLASSSKGNCALVSCNDTYFLIDAGISMRAICNKLKLLGIGIDQVKGIAVTHEHIDHIKGIDMLVKYFAIKVYACQRVAEAICRQYPQTEPMLKVFNAGDGFEIGGAEIQSFVTPHDTPESVGYIVDDGRKKLAFVTDLGYVPESVFCAVRGADTIILEANHDVDMLRDGDYPEFLKRRIGGRRGHLSNAEGAELAVRLAGCGASRFVLAHLSEKNNTPNKAYTAVASALERCGAFKYTQVAVAPASEISTCYAV